MQIYLLFVLAFSKITRKIVRLRGHGGSALPGLIAERLLPSLGGRMLNQLPDGVIVISGTNGKTTTTKMVMEVLEAAGKRVLTNNTGSNFTRGIASAIMSGASWRGALKYDIAVFELDEAYGAQFAKGCRPAYVVALNITRDQLDRFAEPEVTAELLRKLLQSATKACVINGDDPMLTSLAPRLAVDATYFGVTPELRKDFPADRDLWSRSVADHRRPVLDVELMGIHNQEVSYRVGDTVYLERMAIKGRYNYQNAAACMAVVRLVLPDMPIQTIFDYLGRVEPAFGRGETMYVAGALVEIILVKNPSGFRQSLVSFNTPAVCMIAINNNDADGRDVSWLWDVDFSSLRSQGVYVVAGSRAKDMARRLQYDDVPIQNVEPDVRQAVKRLVRCDNDLPRRIFCTYTAMLQIRGEVSKHAQVSRML